MSPREPDPHGRPGDDVHGGARRVLGFLRKELLQIRRDPSSTGLALVMPVVLILLFGYGVSLDAEHVPVAVVLDDDGAAGRDLYARFEGSRYFAPVRATSVAAANALMAEHAVDAIVRVGPDFDRRMRTGRTAPVQLVVRGVDS